MSALKNSDFKILDSFLPYASASLNLKLKASKSVMKRREFYRYRENFWSFFDRVENKKKASILIHRDQGRSLLTGSNGIYDRYIKEKLKSSSKKNSKFFQKNFP